MYYNRNQIFCIICHWTCDLCLAVLCLNDNKNVRGNCWISVLGFHRVDPAHHFALWYHLNRQGSDYKVRHISYFNYIHRTWDIFPNVMEHIDWWSIKCIHICDKCCSVTSSSSRDIYTFVGICLDLLSEMEMLPFWWNIGCNFPMQAVILF